ncbi:hypothetical protein ACFLXJ_06765 [Chloroflexota bacterium]
MTVATELKKLSGVRYESEHELHLALEIILGKTISYSEFNKAKPSWYGPPYGELTLRECLLWFGYEIRGQGKSRRIIKTRRKHRHHYKYPFLPFSPASEFITKEKKQLKKQLLKSADNLRLEMGIGHSVSLDRLKDRLLELGAREVTPKLEETEVVFPFVKSVTYIGKNPASYLIEIDYVGFPVNCIQRSETILSLLSAVQHLSASNQWHPALSLAVVMCDIAPVWDVFQTPSIIYYCGRVQVMIPSIELAPKVLAQTYTQARNSIAKRLRKVKGRLTRLRSLSERTKKLINFVQNTPELNWTERLRKWEEVFPDYPVYKNINTMAVVYSRAKKKSLFRR